MEIQENIRSDTKQNLILSALSLFAKQGIDAVSMRTINNAAGTKNASAVHYHFGSKLGIIEAIIAFIKSELDTYRVNALTELEKRVELGDDPSLREIMWAIFEPYYRLYMNPEYGRDALRFLARLHTDMSPEVQQILNRDPQNLALRFDALIARALPELNPQTRQARYVFFWTFMVQGFSGSRLLKNTSFGDLRSDNEEEGLRRFFDYLVGGLEGYASASKQASTQNS